MDGSQNEVTWNCRGVKTAASEIKKLCKSYQPRFLFLSETKMDDYGSNGTSNLARKLGFNNYNSSRAIGTAGGIALF